MHLLIIQLEMLTWKLLFRSVAVFHMCNMSHLSDRATNPLNRDTDWSSIHAFCDQLNSDLEG